jgi:hypothetical protein
MPAEKEILKELKRTNVMKPCFKRMFTRFLNFEFRTKSDIIYKINAIRRTENINIAIMLKLLIKFDEIPINDKTPFKLVDC